MHPLLRALEQTVNAKTTSSAFDPNPIRNAATSGDRALPLLLSLGLTPLFIYCLAIGITPGGSGQQIQLALDQARQSVPLLLYDPSPSALAPFRQALGPNGVSGVGHLEGTNTIDSQRPVDTNPIPQPSDAIDFNELTTSNRAEAISLSFNPALPIQAGGNGLTRGTDRDVSQISAQVTPTAIPDHQLIPIHKATFYYHLPMGTEPFERSIVKIRLLVGLDGVPREATYLNGMLPLKDYAIRAAMNWRFEPLGAHGFTKPATIDLTFYPDQAPSRH